MTLELCQWWIDVINYCLTFIYLIFYPLIIPGFYIDGYLRERELRHTRAPPRAIRRRRAISQGGHQQVSQLQSRLFQLPAELRIKIYEEVIRDDVGVHVVTTDGALRSVVCQKPKDDAGDHDGEHVWLDCLRKRDPCVPTGGYGLGVLGFIGSCRQAYTELIHIIYSRPTFIFQDYASQIVFSASILPQRFHAIRSIRIMQTHESYHNHDRIDSTYPFLASYRLLRRKSVTVRNSDLPSMKQPGEPKSRNQNQALLPDIDTWQHICQIMSIMRGLKKFRLDVNVEMNLLSFRLAGPGQSVRFWSELRSFSESREFGDGFEVVSPQPMATIRKQLEGEWVPSVSIRGRKDL